MQTHFEQTLWNSVKQEIDGTWQLYNYAYLISEMWVFFGKRHTWCLETIKGGNANSKYVSIVQDMPDYRGGGLENMQK